MPEARETMEGRWDATQLLRAIEVSDLARAASLAHAQVSRWERLDNAVATAMTDLRCGVSSDEMKRRAKTRDAQRQRKHRAALAG